MLANCINLTSQLFVSKMFVLTLFANISVSNSLPYQPSIINLIFFIYVFLVLGIFIFILLSISIKFEILLL